MRSFLFLFFLIFYNSIFDGELKNFPNGTTLKIIITVQRFVFFHFFSDTRYYRALLAATREYHPSVLDVYFDILWGTKSIDTCHFYIDDNSYFGRVVLMYDLEIDF